MMIMTAGLTLKTKQLHPKCGRRDWRCGGKEKISNKWGRDDGHVVIELTVTLEREKDGDS